MADSHPTQNCSICITPLGETNKCTLDCGHSFHYSCVFRWNSENQSCPMCRNQVNIAQAASPPLVHPRNTRNFRDIIQNSSTHGFKVQCKVCECFLVECDDCGDKMCDCLHNRQPIPFFNTRNPFIESYRSEAYMDTNYSSCSKCFFNREEVVLDLRSDTIIWKYVLYL